MMEAGDSPPPPPPTLIHRHKTEQTGKGLENKQHRAQLTEIFILNIIIFLLQFESISRFENGE